MTEESTLEDIPLKYLQFCQLEGKAPLDSCHFAAGGRGRDSLLGLSGYGAQGHSWLPTLWPHQIRLCARRCAALPSPHYCWTDPSIER